MNIYARYFNQDTIVHNFDELMQFLASIPEIPITPRMENDVHAYVESDNPYPKRYKIRPRVYFILIKTNAETMEEFKTHRKDDGGNYNNNEAYGGNGMGNREEMRRPMPMMMTNKRDIKAAQLAEERYGWYLGTIVFKRVLQIAGTTKFRYQDTTFQAYVKAKSGAECYNRVIEHLKNRTEIDPRSQFPSAKGSSFTFEYVGTELPTE